MYTKLLSSFRWLTLLALVIVLPGTMTLAAPQMPDAPAAAAPDSASYSLTCPFAGGGDGLDRGFVVNNFTADSLGSVTLRYYPSTAGTYEITLTAREGAFNGPVIGSATVSFAYSGADSVDQTFNFGSAPVNNPIIAFSQMQVSGPASLYYDYGTGGIGDTGTGLCPGLIQTAGTSPPLDSHRRDTIGVIITSGSAVNVPGCAAFLDVPAHSVGGRFVANAALHWMPGSPLSPALIIPAGNTARVLGVDESGQYYQIIWSCQKLWVPVDTMGPNYDDVWNGQPLPTVVVEESDD